MYPLISVIVPVYNVEGYVERCINSLLRQSHPYLEIIIVVDGATDRSGIICDTLSQKDPRIQVIHKPNGGVGDARNVGVQAATGEYIGFVDGDDYIHHQMYEVLRQQLELHRADIAECDYVKVVGHQAEREYSGAPTTLCDNQGALTQLMQWKKFDISVWNKLYRRKVVEQLPFPVGIIHEDEFWTYRAVFQADLLVHVHFPMYFYQQRADSILGAGFSPANFASTEALLERIAFMRERMPQLAQVAEETFIVHIFYHLRRLAISHKQPLSETKPYFDQYAILLGRQDKVVLRSFCTTRKRRLQIWFARVLIKIHIPLFRIVSGTLFKIKHRLGRDRYVEHT